MKRAKTLRHTADIRTNEKIAALIGDHGPAGYGVYWMIMEMIYNEERLGIEYSEQRMKRLGGQVGMAREAFAQLLQDMIEIYELLAVADDLLVSRISYTGSTKSRKNAGVVQDSIELPVANASATEASKETTPLPEGYTAEDLEYYNSLTALVAERAPRAASGLSSLKLGESKYIGERHKREQISTALDRLQYAHNPNYYGDTIYDALKHLLEG